ncbi:unnamed protein product [Closterium sp. NIES-64]|nr:unnamed protein product [Closterium sp. NIES-64]
MGNRGAYQGRVQGRAGMGVVSALSFTRQPALPPPRPCHLPPIVAAAGGERQGRGWCSAGGVLCWRGSLLAGFFASGVLCWRGSLLAGFSAGGVLCWRGSLLAGFSAGGVLCWRGSLLAGFSAGRVLCWRGSLLAGFSAGGVLCWRGSLLAGFSAGGVLCWRGSLLAGFSAGGVLCWQGSLLAGFSAGGVLCWRGSLLGGVSAGGVLCWRGVVEGEGATREGRGGAGILRVRDETTVADAADAGGAGTGRADAGGVREMGGVRAGWRVGWAANPFPSSLSHPQRPPLHTRTVATGGETGKRPGIGGLADALVGGSAGRPCDEPVGGSVGGLAEGGFAGPLARSLKAGLRIRCLSCSRVRM